MERGLKLGNLYLELEHQLMSRAHIKKRLSRLLHSLGRSSATPLN